MIRIRLGTLRLRAPDPFGNLAVFADLLPVVSGLDGPVDRHPANYDREPRDDHRCYFHPSNLALRVLLNASSIANS